MTNDLSPNHSTRCPSNAVSGGLQITDLEDMISAMQVLGYTRKDVQKIIPKLDVKNSSLEAMIKDALSLLSK